MVWINKARKYNEKPVLLRTETYIKMRKHTGGTIRIGKRFASAGIPVMSQLKKSFVFST